MHWERTCAKTGLRIHCRAVTGFRVATEQWGPLNPPPRLEEPDAGRIGWSRFDTAGSTLYIAESEEIAFAELLAPYARILGGHDPLAKDAAALGLSLEEFITEVARDWKEQSFMQAGHVMAGWRNRRLLYTLALPESGYWVDIEHPDSMAAIRAQLGTALHREAGLTTLTVADLRGGSRQVTSRIATWIRGQVLDDGSRAAGIEFGSKHGGGRCWAYWMRRRNESVDGEPVTADPGAPIERDRPSLAVVAGRFGLTLW